MANRRDQVVVHLDAPELGRERRIALLGRERSTAKSVISFAYDRQWVIAQDSFAPDPSVPLYEAEQYLLTLPGISTDAAPDRLRGR